MTKKKQAPESKEVVEDSEAAAPEAAAPEVVETVPTKKIVNKVKHRLIFCAVSVAIGGEYVLTESDLKNERLMGKVARANELNMIDLV